jgi:hypothetical protein
MSLKKSLGKSPTVCDAPKISSAIGLDLKICAKRRSLRSTDTNMLGKTTPKVQVSKPCGGIYL